MIERVLLIVLILSAAVADTSAGDDKDLKDLLAWAE